LIRQALVNLVENAIKYSPENSKIRILSEEKNDHVKITIEDQGCGIPPEEIPRFLINFIGWSLRESGKKGTGLGLYLVKYFIELHNGQVVAENRPKGELDLLFNCHWEHDS